MSQSGIQGAGGEDPTGKDEASTDEAGREETSKEEGYAFPIASRDEILDYLSQCPGPRTRQQIGDDLGIRLPEEREGLRRRLRAMERDGQVVYTRTGAYGVAKKMDLVRGRVIGHPDGFGFLSPEETGDDIFLSARQMRRLLHGDRALVGISGLDRRGRREGTVVEILERANHEVVGRYFREGTLGFVVPDNKRIHQDILILSSPSVEHGAIVVARIVEQPDERRQPIGEIVETLGTFLAPGLEIEVAIRAHELPNFWPEAVDAEATTFDASQPPVWGKHDGRRDLRELAFVTIDGEDSRDFDDAIYCEPDGKGFRLWVAIADVSHYVRPGTAMDDEAYNRGNSVYFPDLCLPMLPEVLSNGLCSLNPEVDRLALVCEMRIGARGEVEGSTFYTACIHSHARLTYTVAGAVIEGHKAAYSHLPVAIVERIQEAHKLFKVLLKQRKHRGAIDFMTVETKIAFDAQRKIDSIYPVTRNDAHRLIEECMVAANVAAAGFLLEHEVPGIYRIHDQPKAEGVLSLREFLGELGLTMGGGERPEPKDFQHLLASIEGREDSHLIQTVLLRTQKLAVYSAENIGHFGLAHAAYTHFTSPIRRYPDLLVHRAIKRILAKQGTRDYPYNLGDLVIRAEHCSMTERRADEAVRDVVNWLKCEYIQDRVGEDFDATITSVTSFGLFAELKDIYVEGLIHITSLPSDYYHFDPVHHRLRGERSGREFRLAQSIRVKVARVSLEDKKVDFVLAAEEEGRPARRPSVRADQGAPDRPAPIGKKTGKKKTGKKEIEGRPQEIEPGQKSVAPSAEATHPRATPAPATPAPTPAPARKGQAADAGADLADPGAVPKAKAKAKAKAKTKAKTKTKTKSEATPPAAPATKKVKVKAQRAAPPASEEKAPKAKPPTGTSPATAKKKTKKKTL
jgi:ribonuclease R